VQIHIVSTTDIEKTDTEERFGSLQVHAKYLTCSSKKSLLQPHFALSLSASPTALVAEPQGCRHFLKERFTTALEAPPQGYRHLSTLLLANP